MTIPDECMTDIIKNCPVHGDLTIEQVYIRKPPRNESICKQCNNARSSKYRYLKNYDHYTERKCSRCFQVKQKIDFTNYDWKLSSPYCKFCRKKNSTKDYHKNRSHLKNRFGMTVEQYESMLISQNNCCAICSSPPTNKRLSVDHCHNTGKIRGLLCMSCNQAIGMLKDDIKILKKAISYLKNSI